MLATLVSPAYGEKVPVLVVFPTSSLPHGSLICFHHCKVPLLKPVNVYQAPLQREGGDLKLLAFCFYLTCPWLPALLSSYGCALLFTYW